MRSVVYTVGHSTRPVDQFLDLLLAYGVEQLVDVRTIPKSGSISLTVFRPVSISMFPIRANDRRT